MANTLGVYNPIFYAQNGLSWVRNMLGMAARVHRGIDEEYATRGLGDTINVRRPGSFLAQDAPSSDQDISTDTIPMTLDRWKEVKFSVTDKELAFTGERIINDHIKPAAYALALKIDQDLLALYKDVPWVSNQAGTTMAVADITAAYQVLFDNSVDLSDQSKLHFIIGGEEQNELSQLAAFAQWQGAGQMGVNLQETGQLAKRYGFNFFASQNRPTHTPGALVDAAGTLTGAHAKGATTVAIAAVTAAGTAKAGDSLVIAGSTQRYAITADATATGGGALTVTVTPPLAQAYSNGDVVTVDVEATKLRQNLAFKSDAFAIAFGKLPDFEGHQNRFGMEMATVTDEPSGISVRASMWAMPDTRKIKVALDVLYAVKTLNPNYAVRSRAN